MSALEAETLDDDALIDGFDAHQAMRGLAANTRRRRAWTLKVFASEVHEQGRTLTTADLGDVERFIGPRPTAQTRRCLLGDLRAFFKWGGQRGHVDHDPGIVLEMPTVPKRRPRPLSRDDLDRALTLGSDTPTARTRQVAMMLGAHAGLRVSEIAALRWSDVNVDRGAIDVRSGKGAKDRSIPLAPQLAAALDDLERRDDGYVIGTTGGNVSQRIRQHFRRLGIDHRPHDLRCTFGTECCTVSGGNVVMVSQLLGHTSVQTTMRYIGWTPESADVVGALYA